MLYQMLPHHLYLNENLRRKRQEDTSRHLDRMTTDTFGNWVVKIVGKTIRSKYELYVLDFSEVTFSRFFSIKTLEHKYKSY